MKFGDFRNGRTTALGQKRSFQDSTLNDRFRLGADIHLEPIFGTFRRQSGITDSQPGGLKADIDYQKHAPTNARVFKRQAGR